MFFESSKSNHLHKTKTNLIRKLIQICLLTIIISLLNLLQVHSSQANQEIEEGSRLGIKHVFLKPIINGRVKVSEGGKARELFVLYKAISENNRDKLILRHRRTLPEKNNFNESSERSDDKKEQEVSLREPPEDSSIRTYSDQTTPHQTDGEESNLVSVANGSANGPLDLALAPPTENQVGLNVFIPLLFAGSNGLQEAEYQPSFAELTAAGTAAGLMMSDLAAQADSSEDSPGFEEDSPDSPDSASGELYKGLDKVIAKSSLPIRAQKPPEQPSQEAQTDEDQQPPHESPDSMPENIESLMAVDGQAESIDRNENDQQQQPQPQDGSASDKIQNESGDPLLIKSSAINGKPKSNDDDDGDNDNTNEEYDYYDKKEKDQSKLIPASLPMMNRQGTLLRGDDNQLALMHNSPGELNTAAGHYKKKKVKKVKKIVIKKKIKKKKVKKVKKIKIIKYKKKKKKNHHHHDHGKYYMYAKVPKKKTWEFGFKKGNKKHWISRHEKGHKNKFKTKVKWYDKKSKGKGVQIWDYNHHDKKKKYG